MSRTLKLMFNSSAVQKTLSSFQDYQCHTVSGYIIRSIAPLVLNMVQDVDEVAVPLGRMQSHLICIRVTFSSVSVMASLSSRQKWIFVQLLYFSAISNIAFGLKNSVFNI